MTPWTVACQVPLSVEFFRQEYWSGLPFPLPANLPNPGIKAGSPALQEDALPTELRGKLYIVHIHTYTHTHIYTYTYIYVCTHIYIYYIVSYVKKEDMIGTT